MESHVPSTEQLLTMYKKMLLARRFEEKAGQAYGLKKIQGFCHLYIGQEAVVVGINEAIRTTDWVMTGYRDHVHPLVRGAAVWALSRLLPHAAFSELAAMSNDNDESMRDEWVAGIAFFQ